MTTLMIHAGAAEPDAAVTRMGGVPLVPAGFRWPACRTCEGPMQFVAQLLLAGLAPGGGPGVIAVFMCQNDPGMCDEWSPTLGGNQALLFPVGDLHPATVPPGPETTLGAVSAVGYQTVDAGYEQARESWATENGRSTLDVLGQLGGQPDWIQGDETPDCPACARPMDFLAQLEEGPDHRTAANFGSGSAYAFACRACGTAAFLWQC